MKNSINQKTLDALMAKFTPVAPATGKGLPSGKSAADKNYPMDSEKEFAKRLTRYKAELEKKAKEEAAKHESVPDAAPAVAVA